LSYSLLLHIIFLLFISRWIRHLFILYILLSSNLTLLIFRLSYTVVGHHTGINWLIHLLLFLILWSIWLLWLHLRLLIYWWLTDVDSWWIIWIKICKLLLKLRTLEFSWQISWVLTSLRVLSYFFDSGPESSKELAATSLHEPNFALSIIWEGIK